MDPETFKAVVLNAAIQGKLVSQDPNDEPASVLIERIREERQKMVMEGKIKKEKSDSFIFKRDNHYYENLGKEEICIDSKIQLDLPDCWNWARLESVCKLTMGQSPEGSTYGKEGMEFHQGKIHFGDLYLKESNVKTSNPLRVVEPNTILMSVRAPVGPTNITLREVCIGRGLCGIKPILCETEYIIIVLTSLIEEVKTGSAGSTFDSIGKDEIKQLLIPIPPLEEQKRICCAVKKHLNLSKIHREMKNYSLRCNNELRQSILLSAIQGKLVPQDPQDMPVRIQCKNPIIRRDNSYYEIIGKQEKCIDDQMPFTRIPSNWIFTRLSSLTTLISGRDLEPTQYSDKQEGTVYLTGASNLSNGTLVINRWTKTPISIACRGDILITCKGTVGSLHLLTECDNVHIARQIMAIRPNNPEMTGYLFYFLQLKAQELSEKGQGTIPGITRNDISSIMVPVPPISEQRRIVNKLRNLLNLTSQLSC